MKPIDGYIETVRRQYPSNARVREQLEELRDTLHIKTGEYQARGMKADEAAKAAITSMGDVSELFRMLAGETRTVKINRLSLIGSLIGAGIILAECWIPWILLAMRGLFPRNTFVFIAFPVTVATLIYPLVSYIIYRQAPEKLDTVNFEFKKSLTAGLVGWFAISLFLLAANALFSPGVWWFMWPSLGISNWPVNVWLHHRLLASGKYDA